MTTSPDSRHAGKPALSQRHLTGISPLSREDIYTILDHAAYFSDRLQQDRQYRSTRLKDRAIVTAFFENSTRTRLSFEMAAWRLGAEVFNFDSDTSSLKKGESLMDTMLTLDAMIRPDAFIIRHSEYGAPGYIAQRVSCPVINAGDSWREHPTQALLDAFTIRQHKGRIDGLNIAICGDIAHSRVANSNMLLLTRLGANVRAIAPQSLLPQKMPIKEVTAYDNLEKGLKDCDVIMTLRLQKERMQAGLINSDADYFRQFGLSHEKIQEAKPDALIMHPGPMNRGVEISDELADDPKRSCILDQVANGIPVRMAVLDLLAGSNMMAQDTKQ